MTCRQIDDFLDRSSAELPPEAAAHLARCERCSRLREALRLRPQPPEPTLETQRAISRTLAASLGPVKPLPPARRIGLALLVAFLLLFLVLTAWLGAGAARLMSFWQLVGVVLIIAISAALLAVSLSRQVVPGSYHRIPPAWLIAGFLSGFLFGVALLFPWGSTEMFVSHGVGCSLSGLLIAVPAAVLFWVILRRGVSLSTEMLGASVGALAGLVGGTVLQFHCLMLEASHMMVWHVGIVVLSTLAGFLLGRLAPRLRARL